MGSADRFKENLIEIFIFSLLYATGDGGRVKRKKEREEEERRERADGRHHPSARGRIIIYSCGLTREQSSVFTRTFSRSQSLEIVSLLSAVHSMLARARACMCIYLGAASFPRRSSENSPERTSRHLARVPLGGDDDDDVVVIVVVVGSLCTKGGRVGHLRHLSPSEIESHPPTASEKLSTLLPRLSGDC